MAIAFEHVNFSYDPSHPAGTLKDITFQLPKQGIVAVVGQTGSGKSTLIQHLNGLLLPTTGEVHVGEHVITAQTREKDLAPVRQLVGMVFQFPESQLFAATVLADVMYGPLNFGYSRAQAEAQARAALERVGLPERFWQQSPFDLSGGQMRRVAIASTLATAPQVIVFDEPAAGLDPQGQRELSALLSELAAEGHLVLLVTHHMAQVVALADQVLVLADGKLVAQQPPQTLFQQPPAWLQAHGLALPPAGRFAEDLRAAGWQAPTTVRPLTVAALAQQINQESAHE